MRLLVMSDLHANWPALEAVLGAESYDALLIGGDLVTYGPHPCEVVAFVERHASLVVRGLSRYSSGRRSRVKVDLVSRR